MRRKVNPSGAEAVKMVCSQVSGNDHAIALAAGAGELELNVMTPLVATNLAESLELLTRATRLLRTRCIAGLRVDRARVRDLLRSEEHTSELQSQSNLVCRLLLEKKKKNRRSQTTLRYRV